MNKKIMVLTILIGLVLCCVTISNGTTLSKTNLCINNKKTMTAGLLGYWSFDDGTATDSSGNNHNGNVLGATPISGVLGQALDFNGVDDEVDIPDTTDFIFSDQSLTITAWVQILDNPNEYRTFLSLGDTDALPNIILCKSRSEYYDGKIFFQITDSDQNTAVCMSIDNGENLPKEEWIHIAAVINYENNNIKLFINGILQDTQSLINFDMADASNLNLKIGNYCRPDPPAYNHHHYGPIDEVRIYTEALTDEEIKSLFEGAYKTIIIFGKLTNLQTSEYGYISFEAEKIRCIQFAPFQFVQYTDNEKIMVLDSYMGMLTLDRVFGVFKTLL
jgi:hypothetical protein